MASEYKDMSCANQIYLQDQVLERKNQTWPTPTCQEVEHPEAELTETGRRLSKDGKSSHSLNLADSVKQWPTPAARDHKGANSREHCEVNGTGRKHMDQLPNAVAHGPKHWPTPRCQMVRNTQEDRNKSNLEEKVGQTKSMQLSPDWVEWLMGWPIGWTNLEPIGDMDWRDWKADPADDGEVPRVATGIKCRADRLKAIGNGQVPQVAALAWTILTK